MMIEKWQHIVQKDVAKWLKDNPGVIYKGKIERPTWLQPTKKDTSSE